MNLATGKDAAKAMLRAGKAVSLRDEQKRMRDAPNPQIEPNYVKTSSQMDRRLRRKIASGTKIVSGLAFEAMRRRHAQSNQPAGLPATKPRVRRSRVPRLSA